MLRIHLLAVALLLPLSQIALAQDSESCGDSQIWDTSMSMCMPKPNGSASQPTKMLMFQGYSFFTETAEERPRGRDAFSVPNMFMVDLGSSVGSNQFINLDLMGTFERWTFPENGTPELLQIGETQKDNQPYLDAQHPHSSPIMGLTLSDAISLGQNKDAVKVWFAPRGESTDGPVAFMHRPTGVVNPDAPLGHHIGQDVGHISSTVIGGSLRISDATIEFSTFNGTEPDPTKSDLPVKTPNSYAMRFTQDYDSHLFTMISAAYVKSPEPNDDTLDHLWRYSASVYADKTFDNNWTLHNALIWGLINGYDNAAALNSFTEEFLFRKSARSLWGRVEVLQRTLAELEIDPGHDPDVGHWATAATVGYTHNILKYGSADIGLGASLTKYFLPSVFKDSYGRDPVAGKIFMRVGAMKMWEL